MGIGGVDEWEYVQWVVENCEVDGGNRRGGWVRICGVGGWEWVRWICGNSRGGWVGIGRMDGWE